MKSRVQGRPSSHLPWIARWRLSLYPPTLKRVSGSLEVLLPLTHLFPSFASFSSFLTLLVLKMVGCQETTEVENRMALHCASMERGGEKVTTKKHVALVKGSIDKLIALVVEMEKSLSQLQAESAKLRGCRNSNA